MRERMRVSFVLDMSDGVAPQSSTDAHCNSHGKYCILPLSWIYDIPIIVHHLIQKTINPTMLLTTYSPSMLGTTTPIIIVVVRAVQYHHRYPFVRFPKYGTPGPSYQIGYFSLEGVFVLSYRIPLLSKDECCGALVLPPDDDDDSGGQELSAIAPPAAAAAPPR